jgi:hypothetical protein
MAAESPTKRSIYSNYYTFGKNEEGKDVAICRAAKCHGKTFNNDKGKTNQMMKHYEDRSAHTFAEYVAFLEVCIF